MNFLQLVSLLVICFPLISWAQSQEEVQEKAPPSFQLLPKDVYFQPGGGLRVRYENLRNATAGAFPEEEDESQATHRAHIDLRMYKGEYFETFFRLLNFSEWGSANGDTSGGQRDGFSRTNGILVNQAYALWKVDDTLGMKFGRAPLHLGLGYTYGANDWFNVPYSFDYFDFSWDWDSVRLSIIASKVQELTRIASQSVSSDPEENHIIINLDLKNIWDSLNIFNFSFVQVNRDAGSADAGATIENGLNSQRFALEAAIRGKQFFADFFVAFVTGEEKVATSNQVNSVGTLTLSQSAADIKMGYQFPESNKLRLWGGYHFDSGDADNSDSKSQSYDSFFYEVYGQAGLMDFLRWGNLAFYRLGFDLEIVTGLSPFPEMVVGAEWLQFERSEATDGIQFGDAGSFLSAKVTSGDFTLGSGNDLGSELDIWLEIPYPSGVNIRTTFTNFQPGEAFKSGTTPSGNTASRSFFQFLTQVGYSF